MGYESNLLRAWMAGGLTLRAARAMGKVRLESLRHHRSAAREAPEAGNRVVLGRGRPHRSRNVAPRRGILDFGQHGGVRSTTDSGGFLASVRGEIHVGVGDRRSEH